MRYLELPDELLPLTLRGLSPDELAVAAAVCTALRRVSEADSLWADVDLQLRPSLSALPPGLKRRLAATTSLRVSLPHRGCRVRHAFLAAQGADASLLTWSCGGLSDSGLLSLLQACGGRLVSLDLGGQAHLTSAALVDVLAVTSPTLQTLRLRGCTAVGGSSWSFHVKAFGVDGPPQLPQLRHVDFSHTDATDALVGALLRRAPRLECVSLNFLDKLGDEPLRQLLPAPPPSLRSLGLMGCPRVSDSLLRSLLAALPASSLLCDISFVCDLAPPDLAPPDDENTPPGAAEGRAGVVPDPARSAAAAEALDRLLSAYHREQLRQ